MSPTPSEPDPAQPAGADLPSVLPSALPSVTARVVAFTAVVVAGAAGGLIGWALVHLQCHGNCSATQGLGGLVGAVVAAGGVAIVATLVLRAMGEWRAGTRSSGSVGPSFPPQEDNDSRRKPSA